MAIRVVDIADAWAVRDLTICVRNLDNLPPYARELVKHLQDGGEVLRPLEPARAASPQPGGAGGTSGNLID